jgi:hypothetical protein
MIGCRKFYALLFWVTGPSHSGIVSILPPWKWTFGEWKPVVVRIHMLQKWNAQTFLRKAKFHTEKEAKWSSKMQKTKVFRLPFLLSQQKRLIDQSFFTIQMSLGFFRAKFPMEMKAARFCVDVYFAYFPVWNFICQICGLIIRQAKRS